MSEEKVEIKSVKLNNGNEIPIVGLGTFGVYIKIRNKRQYIYI